VHRLTGDAVLPLRRDTVRRDQGSLRVGTVYEHGETFELVFARSAAVIRADGTLHVQSIQRL
jgi:hypothetical protein